MGNSLLDPEPLKKWAVTVELYSHIGKRESEEINYTLY